MGFWNIYINLYICLSSENRGVLLKENCILEVEVLRELLWIESGDNYNTLLWVFTDLLTSFYVIIILF
jgi:hypothetical protein